MVKHNSYSYSLALLATFAATPVFAAEGKFYLSTERVFAPGQPVEVKLEAHSVTSLEVRLYRIAEPRAYFDAQADLHRPANDHADPRKAAWPMLRRGMRRGLTGLLEETRGLFGNQGRAAIRGALPELHGKAMEGGSEVTAEVVLPPLQAHQLLEVWRHTLSGGGGWVYDALEIPAFEPGAYLVEATSGAEVATTVVLITDVALITKQSSSELLVWAVDPATGDPRPGTTITVIDEKTEEKTSGADGAARFSLGLIESPVIYGRLDASFTLIDPRFYPANLPEPRVYLFTERPVYRPGQEVFFKGLAREIADESYKLPKRSGDPIAIEVIDPKGESWATLDVQLSATGAFDGSFELPETPALGMWQVVASMDGKRHAGQFKVLAFVKPEVRLDVRLDSKAVRSGQKVSGDVIGAYFFGAPYPDADVKISVSRTRFYIPWYIDADYSWYYSESEYRNTAREVIQDSSCKLDTKGECTFSFVTKDDSEDYTYIVEATAVDPTGKTISGSAQATVTKGAFRLAFKPSSLVVAPGAKQTLTLEAEDYAGKPISTPARVKVSAQRLAADGVMETVEVADKTVTTDTQGLAVIEVDPSRGGYYEVVATAKDDRGVEVKADTFLFASEGKGDLPFTPSDLELVTDKRSYFAGETALVLILAPVPEGHVLFTVEGGALYRSEVIKVQRHAALAKVEIGARQTPNFFLGAVCVSGGQVYSRQRSVIVPPREKLLTVEVAPDRPEAQPGEEVSFTVHVTDWSGKPVSGAEVALGVVDEAIYAISPEIAVPLEAFFHPRKRNDVRTQDSVTFRFFGTSEALFEQTAWVGDPTFRYGSLKPQAEDLRRIFKDTAGWFPSLITGGDGKVSAKVKMPDNLTAWRATARVITEDARVGLGTGSMKVKKPLVVRLALSPRLVEGDSGSGALIVQNLSGADRDVDVALELKAMAEGDPTPPSLTIKGEGLPGKIAVKDGQTRRVPFTWTAAGSGRMAITVKANGGPVSDGLETMIDVGEWAIVRRVVAAGRTSPARLEARHELELPEGAKTSEATYEIELASSTFSAIRGALPYLIAFPYGCTEQTMSRFLPVLTAQTTAKTLSLNLPELEKDGDRLIASGVARLWQLQHASGAWGWWEEDGDDPFMTAWVLEGLGEAIALGQTVDETNLNRGIEALNRMLSSAPPADVRAFALYALSRHKKQLPAMIDQLGAEVDSLSPSGLAHLILAAKNSGKNDVAEKAKNVLAARAIGEEDAVHFGAVGGVLDAKEHALEATPLAVMALIEVGDHKTAADAVTWLMSQYQDGRFGTTRQTALVVRALAKQLEKAPAASDATLAIDIDGEEVWRQSFDAKKTSEPALRFTAKKRPAANKSSVVITQTGGGSFHYSVSLVAPVRARALDRTGSGGLKLEREYLSLSGSAGAYKVEAASKKIEPGDTVLVHLRIDASQAIDHVIIEDLRAAGLSAVTADSGVQVQDLVFRREGVHREHRDDRTAFFLTHLPRGEMSLYYLARAGLGGKYHALPAKIEAMYLPNTHQAQSASAVLEVGQR